MQTVPLEQVVRSLTLVKTPREQGDSSEEHVRHVVGGLANLFQARLATAAPADAETTQQVLHVFLETCAIFLARKVEPSREERLTETLTPRQRAVLACILRGRSEKEAASDLELSPHTVHVHMKALYRSFGVRSRGELMSLFITANR